MPYAELTCRTHYSFLRGASSPETIIQRAAALGLSAVAITDRNGVYGFPKAYLAHKNLSPEARARLKLIVGAELTLRPSAEVPGPQLGPDSIIVLARTRRAYGLLCRMITAAHAEKEKGQAHLTQSQVLEWLRAPDSSQGSPPELAPGPAPGAHPSAAHELVVLLPPPLLAPRPPHPWPPLHDWIRWARQLIALRTANIHVPVFQFQDRFDSQRLRVAAAIAKELATDLANPNLLIAANDVHFATAEQKPLHDIVTSIREGTTTFEAGELLLQNSENRLKSEAEMLALGPPSGPRAAPPRTPASSPISPISWPELVRRTDAIAREFSFDPAELRYRYPSEWIPQGHTSLSYLEELAWQGAQKRYGTTVPPEVRRQLQHELSLIHELGFADYFLTIWEIVEFARSRKILCQGRGSAANSAVCYVLGITAIDPVRMNLLFERFISAERGEPPDIDVDFEHERREEVIQHVYERYGRDRAGMVAALITYRSRSARREVAKALGLPLQEQPAQEQPAPAPGAGARPIPPEAQALLETYSAEIYGTPRHLSIHSGGFTLSADPIIETVPIEPARMEGRTIVQWDKNDLDAMGLLKVDLLSLGMLSAIKKTLALVGRELHEIPPEDPATYRMIQRADTVGVFQIESRAQMSMLTRLLPRTFYDLVVEIAIVRPGPIVGKMVHPYLVNKRARERGEKLVLPDPRLEPILGRTLGVPLFQEQIMKIAITLAGFSPGEADQLRRAIGAWRTAELPGGGRITEMGTRLMQGLLAHGLPQEFADRIFEQIRGFAEYGFPESHAASFALIAYASAWLKCHHPAEFTASLINSQPMGFYSNATLIEDARRHGVKILPVCARESQWDCTVVRAKGPAGPPALRLGFRIIQGLQRAEYESIAAARAERPFCRPGAQALGDFVSRVASHVKIRKNLLNQMAMGGVFDCFGLDRRQTLWQLLAPEAGELGSLLQAAEPQPGLPGLFAPLTRWESIEQDARTTGVFTSGHPVHELRLQNPALPQLTTRQLRQSRSGPKVSIFGLLIVLQRPPTAKGTCFATLEDHEGFVDLIFRKEIFEACRERLEWHSFVTVTGRLQGTHSLLVEEVESLH